LILHLLDEAAIAASYTKNRTTARAKAAGATSASLPRMSRPGIYRNCGRHLVFVPCGEPHLVVGDIPGLDANHAAPGGVAKIDHGGGLFSPGIPHHARGGADLLDDDAAAPPAIFNGAPPRRIGPLAEFGE